MATDRTAAGDGIVQDLSPVFRLVTEPKFAELYAALRGEPATIPDLLPELSIEKSTAYKYADLLAGAGLVSDVGTEGNSALYRANDFHLTVHISETEVEVTPELARVIAHRSTNPEIDRFIDQYGVGTLGGFVPLAREYSEGGTTHRAIAERLDISRAAAFDMLREVLDILDIVPESSHARGGDRSDAEVNEIVEDARTTE